MRALLLAGMASLVAAAPARAVTFTVTGTDDGAGSCARTVCTTLRAAVTAANGNTTADTIQLGALSYSLSGQLAVGTDVTLAGARADTTSISGDGNSGRVFDVSTGGKLTVKHATIANGLAPSGEAGGNVRVGSGTQLVLDHVRVTGGTSSGFGGGGVGVGPTATATISHSLIDNNHALGATGGGIFMLGNAKLATGTTLTITDSTITANTASSRAGIAVTGDTRNVTTLTRSTVASNPAGSNDGGAGIFVNTDGGSFGVTASIISGNTGDGVPINCSGTLTSGGGNVDSGATCGLATPTDRQNTDPQLQPLTGGFGETPVMPISSLSPAVDRVPVGAAACTGTDQRDLPRPQGPGCDSGAFEVEQAPDTKIDSGPNGTITVATATFTFSSTEPGVTFQCRFDAAATFTSCTSPQTYSGLAEGAHTFRVRAVDVHGADETPATRSFTVDLPPDTSITGGPSGPNNNSSPSFTFTADQTGSTFQCKLDGPRSATGSFATCSSPKTYSSLADGAYTLSVRAIDPGGNIDATPATRSFTVDTVVPVVNITSGPSGLTNNASPSFGFNVDDATATVQCKLDAGAFAACSSPKSYSALTQGAHTFTVRATDAAGNAGTATRSFTVDTVAPDTSIGTGPSGVTTDSSPSFGFSSPDVSATFQCRLDGPGTATGSFAPCSSPKSYSGLADGGYTFRVRAIDPSGNIDATPATRSFTIDTGAPVASITSGPSGLMNSRSASFAFDADDPGATFQCKLDTPSGPGAFAVCSSPKDYSALADGAYTFSVRALDAAQNIGPPASRSFTIDATAPQPPAITAPAENALQKTSTVTLSGTAEPGSAVGVFEGASSRGNAVAGGGGTWTVSFPAPDGTHAYTARATDAAGNVSGSSNTRHVRIDTKPPPAAVTSGPSGTTSDSSPTFAFSSPDPAARFECRLDGPGTAVGTYHACAGSQAFSGLAPGSYTFRLRVRDAAGNVTETSRAFTVTGGAPKPPKPKPHKTVVVAPVRGVTLIKLPGSNRFVPLDVTKGIPLGSTVDTRHSRIRLSALRGAGDPLETALFYGGIFKVTQSRAVTQLRLVERLACKGPGKASTARRRAHRRRLWGSGKGRFRTRGQYSAATVRGTKWLTQDSCGRTLTRVVHGVVAVRDFARHKTVTVRGGHRYTARKR